MTACDDEVVDGRGPALIDVSAYRDERGRVRVGG